MRIEDQSVVPAVVQVQVIVDDAAVAVSAGFRPRHVPYALQHQRDRAGGQQGRPEVVRLQRHMHGRQVGKLPERAVAAGAMENDPGQPPPQQPPADEVAECRGGEAEQLQARVLGPAQTGTADGENMQPHPGMGDQLVLPMRTQQLGQYPRGFPADDGRRRVCAIALLDVAALQPLDGRGRIGHGQAGHAPAADRGADGMQRPAAATEEFAEYEAIERGQDQPLRTAGGASQDGDAIGRKAIGANLGQGLWPGKNGEVLGFVHADRSCVIRAGIIRPWSRPVCSPSRKPQ